MLREDLAEEDIVVVKAYSAFEGAIAVAVAVVVEEVEAVVEQSLELDSYPSALEALVACYSAFASGERTAAETIRRQTAAACAADEQNLAPYSYSAEDQAGYEVEVAEVATSDAVVPVYCSYSCTDLADLVDEGVVEVGEGLVDGNIFVVSHLRSDHVVCFDDRIHCDLESVCFYLNTDLF